MGHQSCQSELTCIHTVMGGQTGRTDMAQLSVKDYLSYIHPYLRSTTLVHSSEGPLLQLNLPIHPHLQLDHWLEKSDLLLDNLASKYLFLSQNSIILKEYCSTQETLALFYEFYPFCLDKEIRFRRVTNKRFSEGELWYLLFMGLGALTEFQRLNENIGRVCPQNILMNCRGNIRFMNKYTSPEEPFKSLMSKRSEVWYMSPEELEEQTVRKSKSDLFALGLILTECCVLQSVEEVYRDNRFRREQLYMLMQRLYSLQLPDLLVQIVKNMVEPNAQIRPLASAMLKQLKPYESQILHFLPFC